MYSGNGADLVAVLGMKLAWLLVVVAGQDATALGEIAEADSQMMSTHRVGSGDNVVEAWR